MLRRQVEHRRLVLCFLCSDDWHGFVGGGAQPPACGRHAGQDTLSMCGLVAACGPQGRFARHMSYSKHVSTSGETCFRRPRKVVVATWSAACRILHSKRRVRSHDVFPGNARGDAVVEPSADVDVHAAADCHALGTAAFVGGVASTTAAFRPPTPTPARRWRQADT